MKTAQTRKILVLSSILFYQCSSKEPEIVKEELPIKFNGSDTEFLLVQDLCNSFAENSQMKFDIAGDGTQKGIELFITGQVDVANCSRKMNEYEIRMAYENNIKPTQVIIALDAIAFVAHPKNPVDSLSTLQIKSILSGEINNWKQLGGPDRPINFYGRTNSSGTYQFLQDRFVHNEGFAKGFAEFETNKEIAEAVQKDTFGLGYVGAGFLTDDNGKPNSEIWAMYLYTEGENAAYSPYEYQAVMSGDYPLVRPLYQYYNGIPTDKLMNFLQFELSFEGQEIVKAHGFFPISSKEEYENQQQGIVVK